MFVYKKLSDEDARVAIEQGDFSNELLTSSEYVAIIPTQSWCSQWLMMQQWLRKGEVQSDIDLSVYYYEYDLSDLFDDFRKFKEGKWENGEVPYIRYYHNGKLISTSNFIAQHQFFATFRAKG